MSHPTVKRTTKCTERMADIHIYIYICMGGQQADKHRRWCQKRASTASWLADGGRRKHTDRFRCKHSHRLISTVASCRAPPQELTEHYCSLIHTYIHAYTSYTCMYGIYVHVCMGRQQAEKHHCWCLPQGPGFLYCQAEQQRLLNVNDCIFK